MASFIGRAENAGVENDGVECVIEGGGYGQIPPPPIGSSTEPFWYNVRMRETDRRTEVLAKARMRTKSHVVDSGGAKTLSWQCTIGAL